MMLTQLALLFAIVAVGNANLADAISGILHARPVGSVYDYLPKSGVCTGTADLYFVAPTMGRQLYQADIPITFANNLVTREYIVIGDPLIIGTVYGNNSGHWLSFGGAPCSRVPTYTYELEKAYAKSTVWKTGSLLGLLDLYSGQAQDPGMLGADIHYTARVNTLTGFTIFSTFEQRLPGFWVNGTCQDTYSSSVVYGEITFHNCVSKVPERSYFELPADCAAESPLYNQIRCLPYCGL